MSFSIQYWPFQPDEERLPEETECWWQTCYQPPDVVTTLVGIERSVALVGVAGSGKSVALAALRRNTDLKKRVLTFNYPPKRWPGGAQAYVVDGNHLAQLMAGAAEAIKIFLAAKPERLENLSDYQRGFVRWLIEKRGGRRALLRWADSLGTETAMALTQTPFEDFYPTDTIHVDVKGQIEDLILVARGLGYERVLALIDVPATLSPTAEHAVGDLLGWLEPLQHPGFELKLALPQDIIAREQIISRSRGRVTLTTIQWTRAQVREMANRHLAAATDGMRGSLSELASPGVIQRAEFEIERLFGQPSPRGWVGLAHTLLTLHAKNNRRLETADYPTIVRDFYAHWIPLRLTLTEWGVWRGPQFIQLDEQPYAFLKTLWQAGTRPADKELIRVAGSSANVNTLASRVRKKIEPAAADGWVYLHNRRGQGYWLENIQRLEG